MQRQVLRVAVPHQHKTSRTGRSSAGDCRPTRCHHRRFRVNVQPLGDLGECGACFVGNVDPDELTVTKCLLIQAFELNFDIAAVCVVRKDMHCNQHSPSCHFIGTKSVRSHSMTCRTRATRPGHPRFRGIVRDKAGPVDRAAAMQPARHNFDFVSVNVPKYCGNPISMGSAFLFVGSHYGGPCAPRKQSP